MSFRKSTNHRIANSGSYLGSVEIHKMAPRFIHSVEYTNPKFLKIASIVAFPISIVLSYLFLKLLEMLVNGESLLPYWEQVKSIFM